MSSGIPGQSHGCAPLAARAVRVALSALITFTAVPSIAQGAAGLAPLVDELGVSGRVLMIGAHPDDEDTQLITWLARGRHVETAYLSLTRGDGGQNLIGNELGQALGAIRSEELLAARRIDGGRQYFTRAYDFGFSKSAEETLTQWSRDSILRDVVTVVRAFRPHVIVSVFSGTPADGHGHHQAAGMLAREAWDVAGDTVRLSRSMTAGLGPWTVAKFYRGASFRFQDRATLRINVGEFNPILGRSWAEVAAESRSQHRSQGFGSLQPRGPRYTQLLREATRVNAAQDARSEQSLFDGVDTTWSRFRAMMRTSGRAAALDSLSLAFRTAHEVLDLRQPAKVLPALTLVQRLMNVVCDPRSSDSPCASATEDGSAIVHNPDLFASIEIARVRVEAALAAASGVAVEATTAQELWGVGDSVRVALSAFNRGRSALRLASVRLISEGQSAAEAGATARALAPDSVIRDSLRTLVDGVAQPWWLDAPQVVGGMFQTPGSALAETERRSALTAVFSFGVVDGGATFSVVVPVVHRYADPIRGEVNRAIAGAPAITVTLDREVEYAPANAPIARSVRVHVRSNAAGERIVEVRLQLPSGIVADSLARRVRLARAGDTRTITFNVRGRLTPGRHVVSAVAQSDGASYSTGYAEIRYDHIRTQRLYRPSRLELQAVDVRIPAGMTVGYINGVGDNSAAMLEQLGINVTLLDPAALDRADLSRFRAVVVGTRAYEANEGLVSSNARLLEYARGGGTLVVQYGQYEMTAPGIMPYPITLGRPADRVTVEGSAVRILDPAAPVLSTPNRITLADFEQWQQDRSLYMPRTFDVAYQPALEMNDPGETPNQGGLLVAPLGRGTYVYTSLAFFRQLPNGVPGAARLFVNLLAARAGRPLQ